MTTEALGIFQADVIIRTALIAGIKELRANPWLLDYVFASLPADDLTSKEYGDREVQNAKKWILRTEIPIFMKTRLDITQIPAITIELLSSSEDQATLGDVHYQPSETTEGNWPTLAGPFGVTKYTPADGVVTIPQSIADDLIVVEGMNLVDRAGVSHPIIETSSERTQFKIAKNLQSDFSNAYIKSESPVNVTTLESVVHREVYRIGCHVQSEDTYLSYLWSVVVFVLNRGKQRLFEARGFERMQTSSSQFTDNNRLPTTEPGYSRFIDVTGYVRQYWPKDTYTITRSLTVSPLNIGFEGSSGPAVDETGDSTNEDASWMAEQDLLGFRS
jgi:hypothetical protein